MPPQNADVQSEIDLVLQAVLSAFLLGCLPRREELSLRIVSGFCWNSILRNWFLTTLKPDPLLTAGSRS
jgi:hypothetical protein